MNQASPTQEAMAQLALMSAGPHDVRPHLLLLVGAQDPAARDTCWHYGAAYLTAWLDRRGETAAPAAIEAAAWDALEVLCMRRAQVPADARALDLRMRADAYRRLRRLILDVYRLRFEEACVAFKAGRIATLESLLWEAGQWKQAA